MPGEYLGRTREKTVKSSEVLLGILLSIIVSLELAVQHVDDVRVKLHSRVEPLHVAVEYGVRRRTTFGVVEPEDFTLYDLVRQSIDGVRRFEDWQRRVVETSDLEEDF